MIKVIEPLPGATVGIGGVEVFIRLSPRGDSASETLRVLLNGADVTDELTIGENGAYGELHALLDGENVLRVEVFGRAPWSRARLFEQAREVRIRHRRRLDAHRG